jgi:ATP adenylyltransferase
MSVYLSTCPFCNLDKAPERTPSCNTSVVERNDFITLPSLGAIVPGWLLVISRDHHLCSASLTAPKQFALMEAVEEARSLVLKKFAAPTIFEHGPSSPGTPVGCGIDHLHMHLAPLPGSLANACSELYSTVWKVVENTDHLTAMHNDGLSYMTIQEPGKQAMWSCPPEGVRQPLRRAIAYMMNVPNQFDYRKDFFEENIAFTLKELLSAA